MAQIDAITRRLELMAADAHGRSFGTTDTRKRGWQRHGYLLCLEEIERALADHRREDKVSPP